MSNQDKHITHWSPSDVQKYLRGELSAREMHQLEKAALEDPFLADAIEGLSQRPAAPLATDLDELRARLTARVEKKKKRPLAWMKMAAAILLLLGLGYTAWYILPVHSGNKAAYLVNQKAPLESPVAAPAQTPNASASVPPPRADATLVDSARQSTNATVVEPSFARTGPPVFAVPRKKIRHPDSESFAKADARKSVSDSIAFLSANKAAGVYVSPASANRMVPDSLEAQKRLPGALAFREQAANKPAYLPANRAVATGYLNQNLVYSGQVLDFNNRPLAGASLLVSGPSNAVATTNALGQFKLNLSPQDTTQRLTVAMAGYQNAFLAVNKLNTDQATGNTIILQEQPAGLKEVVVSGMDRSRKEAFAAVPFEDKKEKLDSFWIKVTPLNGRVAYLDYLQTARKTLPVDSTIRGAEVISFAIDPKGAPADFKIEHSLSPAHDAGVIRLIAEGARWKIIRGKNTRAMVSVSFP
jgi:hypothetical protein